MDTTGQEANAYAAFWAGVEPRNLYSQFGEDGILEAIFARIGTANRWCAECGAADGLLFSNTRRLVDVGWSAVLIEADPVQYDRLAQFVHRQGVTSWGRGPVEGSHMTTSEKVTAIRCMVQPEGPARFDALLAAGGAPVDMDLLVIDVDGQDYYLFNSLMKYQPRVVVVEYDPNADPMFIPEIGGTGQAGYHAMAYVANARGYETIGRTQTNLICVRRDLAAMYLRNRPQPAAPVETAGPGGRRIKVGAAMSTPRIGFLANSDCILQALAPHGISLSRGEGAFWHHSLTRGIERQIANGMDYILTIDYDTVFTSQDVARLVVLLEDCPEVDVAVSMQQKREGGELLASSAGAVDLSARYVPITQGHFGLTLFRASVFSEIEKPWFYEAPNEVGEWNENRTDADIGFWTNCERSGVNVRLALDVIVGHLEQVVTWPDVNLRPLYQTVSAYRAGEQRPPAGVFRRGGGQQAASLEMGG